MLGALFQNSVARTTMTTRLTLICGPSPALHHLRLVYTHLEHCFLASAWHTSRVRFEPFPRFTPSPLARPFATACILASPLLSTTTSESGLITPHPIARAKLTRPTGREHIACAFEPRISLAGLQPPWTRATSPSRSRLSSASCTACSTTLASPAMSATRAKQR